MNLTIKEIMHLAQFAGFNITEEPDEPDTEISIERCPKEGIWTDGYSCHHYRMWAYFTEYPEEGMYGLGDKLEEAK